MPDISSKSSVSPAAKIAAALAEKLTFSAAATDNLKSCHSVAPATNAASCGHRNGHVASSSTADGSRHGHNHRAAHHCAASSSSSSCDSTAADALLHQLRTNVTMKSRSAIPRANNSMKNLLPHENVDSNDADEICRNEFVKGFADNRGAMLNKFTFSAPNEDRLSPQTRHSKTSVCDVKSRKSSPSAIGLRAICSSSSDDTDEGIGAANELIQQLYHQARSGAAVRIRATQQQQSFTIPPCISDPPELRVFSAEHASLLRFNLTRASVANNCSRKQRGPLVRWWIVTQLETDYRNNSNHVVMGVEDGDLLLQTSSETEGIGSRKLSIDAVLTQLSATPTNQQAERLTPGKPPYIPSRIKPSISTSSSGSPDARKEEMIEKEIRNDDSGVAVHEFDDADSIDILSVNGDEQSQADGVYRELSPLPETPAMTNLADLLIVLERMCLPPEEQPNRRNFTAAHSFFDPFAAETSEIEVEIRDKEISCAFHTRAADSSINIREFDDDEDDDADDATVLVNQPTCTSPSLSECKGVSKKRYGLVNGSKFTRMSSHAAAGDAYYAAKRYINRTLLAAVVKNFGLLQPDDFMQRCWKKIVSARANQNILILDGPNSASAAGTLGGESIAALRYLVPLISQRCLYELTDTWGDGVGMQPKIAIICKTAADAERLSRTCARLMPRSRIALAIGLETREHEDSRRERRNMLEGAQIIIASSLAFDRYAYDWRAASDMLDEVRVIVVESAAAVLSTPCELIQRWQRLVVANSGELPAPQLILVDSHGPAVGIIHKFMRDINAEQLRGGASSRSSDAAGSSGDMKPTGNSASIGWLKVVAHPLDKLLFDSWQWEFVETAVKNDVSSGNIAGEFPIAAQYNSNIRAQEQLRICIDDIICSHSCLAKHQLAASLLSPPDAASRGDDDDCVLMLACYYSDARALQFITALNDISSKHGGGATVRYSKIDSYMSDIEQRVVAMRWQTSRDCMFHVLLIQDGCSLKTLPTLPKMPVTGNAAAAYPTCEGAIFIDLPENQADFMDRILLLATMPPPPLPSSTATTVDEYVAQPNRRVLYQFFDYSMERAMRGLVFMLNYGQHFVAGNALSKLEHSFAVHAPLQELKRVGPICRQFMLTGTCLLTDAVEKRDRAGESCLTGCLMRHANLNVRFAGPESFLRQGQRFRFELLCMLSPVELVGHLEEIDNGECMDELYEDLCDQLERQVQTSQSINADVFRENDIMIAEHDHCVFRCRLVRKNMPYSIVVEDYDCTLFKDTASGAGSGGGIVMRNGHVQLPLHNTRLFQLPRTLDPRIAYNNAKRYKCFKVKMYMPSLLPAEPAGADLSWFPSVTKTANAFFQLHKNCQIHSAAESFSGEWVAVDDVVATVTLFSVKQKTTNSYKKYLLKNGMATENNRDADGAVSDSINL